MDELRPILPLVVFILGIVTRLPAPAQGVRAALAGACVLLAAAICLVLPDARVDRALAGVCLAAGLILAGGLVADAEVARVDGPLASLPASLRPSQTDATLVRIEGRFAADPECARGWYRAPVESVSFANAGVQRACASRILVSWPAPEGSCEPLPFSGASLSTTARLDRPRSFGNPAAQDAAAHLRQSGAAALGFVKSARLLIVSAAPAPSPSLWARRRYERLFRRYFPAPSAPGQDRPDASLSPEGSVIRASVLGGSGDLDAETQRAMAVTGISHVLAISGLQVAVFGGALLWVLRRCGMVDAAAVLVATSSVIFYGTLTTPSASVQRAVFMGSLAGVSRLLCRRPSPLAILALAGLVELTIHPSAVADPGFQLTFAATGAILVFSPRLRARIPARGGLSTLLSASLAAQAGTLPVVAFWFHRVVPFGLVSNLAAVPLGSAIVVLGILLLPADLAGEPLARAIAALLDVCARAFLCVAGIPVEGTLGSFRVAPPGPGTIALAALGGAVLAAGRTRTHAVLGAALAALACVLLVTGPAPRFGRPGTLTLEAIDVGQGDAILIGLPGGDMCLVDGGGLTASSFDIGSRVLVPELESRGIRRLSRVFLTHAHEDHGGGLRELLRDLEVGEFLSPDAPEGPLRDELEELARRQGTRLVRARRGYRMEMSGATIDILAPFPGARDDPNADSLVVRIRAAGRCALLTGDIGAGAEARLVRSGLEPCEILKVAHHGSASSSSEAFLRAVRPRVAAISVGAGNRFGHPSAHVLDRLRGMKVQTWRSDRDGAVRIELGADTAWAGSARSDAPLPFPGPVLRVQRFSPSPAL